MEQIPVTLPDQEQAFDPTTGRAEAVKLFESKYNVIPAEVSPPYMCVGPVINRKKREIPSQKTLMAGASFLQKRGTAIHGKWFVKFYFTSKKDVVFAFYDGLVDPKSLVNGKKPQMPSSKWLPISVLKDIKDFQLFS